MRDDFTALDLLSPRGLHRALSKPAKKALFGLPRRAKQSKQHRPLTALLPMLASKMKKPKKNRGLQGWPVALSWPNQDHTDLGPLS